MKNNLRSVHIFAARIGTVFLLTSLAACVNSTIHSMNYRCLTGPTISAEEALKIALLKEEIDILNYEVKISQDELAYYIFFKAREDDRGPSFGTIAIDYCGEKIGTTAGPL